MSSETEDFRDEDLFGDSLERDYSGNEELDGFESEGIDDSDYSDNISDRVAAEAELNARDPHYVGFDIESAEAELNARYQIYLESDIESVHETSLKNINNCEEFGEFQPYYKNKGIFRGAFPIPETWNIYQEDLKELEEIIIEIKNVFISDGIVKTTYLKEISCNFILDKFSVSVDFNTIKNMGTDFLRLFEKHVSIIIDIIDWVFFNNLKKSMNLRFFHTKIINYPEDNRFEKISDILKNDRLVKMFGKVIHLEHTQEGYFLVNTKCSNCFGIELRIIYYPKTQNYCSVCFKSGQLEILENYKVKTNLQIIHTKFVPPNYRHTENIIIKTILIGDECDTLKIGENFDCTGYFRLELDNVRSKLDSTAAYKHVLFVNNIKVFPQKRFFTAKDVENLEKYRDDNDIVDIMCKAIAPSIYGNELIKLGLVLGVLGGVEKKDLKIRGNINILICGNPGTGKSSLLMAAKKFSPKAVYVRGNNSTGCGLTAIVKSLNKQNYSIHPGALAEANNGVCLLDGLDELSDSNITSIHEPLAQQEITISKCGLQQTLPAKCSFISSCSPINNRYDEDLPFSKNVRLESSMINRFDLIYVILNKPTICEDYLVARQIFKNNCHSYENSNTDSLTKIQKYITFAKEYIHPIWLEKSNEKVLKFYKCLKNFSNLHDGLLINARSLESILRLSEANARLHLSYSVKEVDVDVAIKLTLYMIESTIIESCKNAFCIHFNEFIEIKTYKNIEIFRVIDKILKEMIDEVIINKRFNETKNRFVKIQINDMELFKKIQLQEEIHKITRKELAEYFKSRFFTTTNFVHNAKEGTTVAKFPKNACIQNLSS